MTIPFYKLCRTCGFFNGNQSVCSRQNIQVNPEEDYCSFHISQDTNTCAICKGPLTIDSVIIEPNIPLCAGCFNAYYNRCEACRHYQEGCAFNEDNSEPHIINQTTRQGFMSIQQQIRNPKLVERHCTKCQCAINKECQRNNHGTVCPNWTLIV
jgi:hypothetical protein